MSRNNASMSQQAHSRLLQLPAELRNLIYSKSLIQDGDTRIQLRDLRPPALLSTCRQIRREASSVYFSGNRFVLTIAISPMAFNPDRSYPRVHRVFTPAWIRSVEEFTPLHMRNVKVEIDHAWKWVVVTMAGSGPSEGRLRVVEAWLHNGRHQLPLPDMRDKVKAFLDWTIDQKVEVDENSAGLNYRDAILIAGKMLRQWAGTIVPG